MTAAEIERERNVVDRGKGGGGETARIPHKDRCVRMHGGREKEKRGKGGKGKVWPMKVRMETKEVNGKQMRK